MKKYLPFITLLLGINYLLLRYYNTLDWPYLWPRPALPILVSFFVIVVSFREFFSGIWLLRIVGVGMIFIGQSYLLHSFQVTIEHFSLIALIHLIGVLGTISVMILNFVNQMTPRSNKLPPPLPDELPHVAVVIPTYGEPYHILENTVISVKQLDYPSERLHIVISDDGHREEIRQLAELYNVYYNEGAQKDAKAGNLNSALEYLDENLPQATLIATQDADEVIAPTFLQKVVGYFEDPNIAVVQTPKEALTPPGDPFGNRDRIFYDMLQVGRNGSQAAFACGSGVIWRIDPIKSIGGFATWNIVEDLTTTYQLHSAGYHSEYHNEILSVGLSPDDIPGLLKQRGTWAADTWRLFLFDNPLIKPGLSSRQRLQYLELGLFYVSSVFFIPLLMLIPIISLATGQFIPIEGAALFPWIVISVVYYVVLSRGKTAYLLRMWQYWIGHWPTYTKAFWIAIRSRNKKPSYQVTRKTRQNGFFGYLVWPQFLYILIGILLIFKVVIQPPSADFSAWVTNAGILTFFMLMVSGICQAAFYGVNLMPVALRSMLEWLNLSLTQQKTASNMSFREDGDL